MPDRKVLCSIGFGPQERLLRLSRPSFERYANRYGYDLDVRTEPLQYERPGQWNKILLLSELVDRYDVVVWVDADAVIIDASRDIADELEDGRFLYLVEHRYKGLRIPNTGVLMLRSGPEARALLDELWNDTDFAQHRWHEQAALMLRLGYVESLPTRPSELRDRKTKFLGTEWNSTPQDGVRNAYVKHTPGHKPLTRMAFMARDLALARARQRLRGR
jgi:hypothetical protein